MLSVYDMFMQSVRSYPDHTAIVKDQERMSYCELSRNVNALACSLHKHGIRAGTRVGFMFRNSIAFAEIFYSLQKIGAVAVPLAFLSQKDSLIYDLNNSQCTVFLCDYEYVPLFREIRSKVPEIVLCAHNGSDLQPDELSLLELIASGDPAWTCTNTAKADDEAMFIFTSGSTGKSKCVVHTQSSTSMFPLMPILSDDPLSHDDILLYYAPMYHTAGLRHLMYVLSTGGTLIIFDGFDAEKILKTWQQEKCTRTFLIPPSLMQRIRDCPDYEAADLSSLKYVMMSGGANAAAYAEILFEKIPEVIISNAYGMSESAVSTISLISREQFEKNPEIIKTVGKPLKYCEMKLLDENGIESNIGHAYARSPNMAKGYLNMDPPFVDGWFPTGDILRVDEDGNYWFMDRAKDMVKTGGENVFSYEVENVIKRLPSVRDCAVVGLPDPIYSEAVSAAIVPNPGFTFTRQDIRDFCAQHLAPYKKPRNVFVVDELPINPTGKIQKFVLVELLKKLKPIE